MVSKKNFQQNGRHMQLQRPGSETRGVALPYKKPFKTQGLPIGNNYNPMMFSASQIPDNPGYLDFNNPTPPVIGGITANASTSGIQQQKKKNNKNKQKNKPQQNSGNSGVAGGGSGSAGGGVIGNGGNWNKIKNPQQQQIGMNTRFNGVNGRPQRGGGGFNHPMPPIVPGPSRGRRLIPPPVGPLPPPPHGFQPPMMHPPPIPPMGRGPLPPMNMQHFLRCNGRGGPMPPIPPQMPPMIPPRMLPRASCHVPPLPFNGPGKVKKPNPKLVKKVVKSKSTIKTLKNLVNQYPLDKPWVTVEIRAEHDKKVDIENRLKGNKDDNLFAQFKTTRDKFVSLYETAREDYLKQEAAAVKAKDAKDKQTNNTAA